jgi:hypothetical protein
MSKPKHLSPSDIRRRERRKIERAALREHGLLNQQPNTFTFFVNRLNPRRSIFKSLKQQDLNTAICCYSYDVAPMEHSGGRISVMTYGAEELAQYLVTNGWIHM